MFRLHQNRFGVPLAVALIWLFVGCGGGGSSEERPQNTTYTLHKDITVTIFWAGEEAGEENGDIANLSSAWDDMWVLRYGGVDTPDRRNGYYPAGFVPDENPFYFALPFNDFDENGRKKENLPSLIPWLKKNRQTPHSVCKNRWIKIIKNGKTAYAQWEDVGPFGEDDAAYVFGTASPANTINDHAGLDVSPAVRDYLGLEDIDKVDWVFVDEEAVPEGPWKRIITVSQVNWTEWYRPDANTTWQWQLNGTPNLSYDADLYDLDLFDTDETTIRRLHKLGRRVICYFSAGTREEWREDSLLFPPETIGKEMEGWSGERWVDIRAASVKEIMRKRLDLAKEKGCDGVEPDNVDGYLADSGFDLSFEDQLRYNKFIANEARMRGLSVGLKNDLEQISQLEPFFDFALNEECHLYEECDRLMPFVKAGKPVFNAEYDSRYVTNEAERERMCSQSERLGIHTLILPLDLDDAFRISCE